MLFFFVKKKAS